MSRKTRLIKLKCIFFVMFILRFNIGCSFLFNVYIFFKIIILDVGYGIVM